MNIAELSLIIVLVGLFTMPIYSSYVMEWRIKRVFKKYELEDLIRVIKEIAEALK